MLYLNSLITPNRIEATQYVEQECIPLLDFRSITEVFHEPPDVFLVGDGFFHFAAL
jgi:hypothetical protein